MHEETTPVEGTDETTPEVDETTTDETTSEDETSTTEEDENENASVDVD